MKLLNRDVLILIIVLVCVFIYGYYTFLYTPSILELRDLEATLETNEAVIESVLAFSSQDSELYLEHQKFDGLLMALSESFFPSSEFDKKLILLDMWLKGAGLDTDSISLDPVFETFSLPVVLQKESTELQQLQQELLGLNVVEEGVEDAQVDFKAIELITSHVTLEGSLNSILNFIHTVNTYEYTVLLSNLTMRASTEGYITAGVDLTFFILPKVHNQDHKFWQMASDPTPEYSDIMAERKGFNPFINTTLGEGEGSSNPTEEGQVIQSTSQPDFVISLRPIFSDLPTVIIGEAKDDVGTSHLTSDLNKVVNVEFEVIYENGLYYYRYAIEGTSQPQEGYKEFEVQGDSVGLVVFSRPVLGEEDKSGINLSIKNRTNLRLVLTLINECESNPRLTLVKKEGRIIVR